MERNELLLKLKTIPKQPGCYLWKDNSNRVIYVGKAKNLFSRTHQYFLKIHNTRIQMLVDNIADFDYIVVDNENESLILENNLIKKYQPKYNVLLKSGSGYPYILVTNEKHPRIIYTHNYQPSKGKYYGPLANNDSNRYEIYNLLLRLIPFRKCRRIPDHKCIYYDMGQCLGPCINQINLVDYKKYKEEINDIFNHKTKTIITNLKAQEQEAVLQMDFEGAQKILDLQIGVDNLINHQVVQLINKNDADIVGFATNDNYICIIIFSYIDGKLLSKHTMLDRYYNDVNETIVDYVMQFYSHSKLPKKIFITLEQDDIDILSDSLSTDFVNPQKGQYKDIVKVAHKNAQKQLMTDQSKFDRKYNRTIGACQELAKLLELDSVNEIEMFDNSNINLDTPVAGMIVYKNGVPNKNEYRKFNLRTVKNASDYHYMYEIILRRYSALIKNQINLPELIIVDGGKPQVNAGLRALRELNIDNIVPLIGLKKDARHRTDAIVLTNGREIELNKTSDLFFFLFNMQEEVHRFAISFFRAKRIKSQLSSVYDKIPGLGPKRKKVLLERYPTVLDLKEATIEEISQIVPHQVAVLLKNEITKTGIK